MPTALNVVANDMCVCGCVAVCMCLWVLKKAILEGLTTLSANFEGRHRSVTRPTWSDKATRATGDMKRLQRPSWLTS